MNKSSKPVIKKYLKTVSKEVICSYSIKKFFIKDLKHKILDFYQDIDNITPVMISTQFGTPREIAAGFNDLAMDKYIKQAKKFKILVSTLILFLVILLAILFIILHEYGNSIIITD